MEVLSPRQQSILNRVVDTHIETAHPVGSRSLTAIYTELYCDSYSSATVRHEMEVLETKGYLTHPHTSAGRVPTDLGYRYYVDHSLRQERLGKDLLQSAARGLAEVREELELVAERVSSLLAGLSEEVSLVLLPSPLCRILKKGERFKVFVQGSSQLLAKPEFQEVKKIRPLLQAFEETMDWADRFAGSIPETGVSVTIGHENQLEVFRECSMVTTRMDLGGGRIAALAIVGPRRMRYSRLVALIREMGQLMAGVCASSEAGLFND